MMVKTNSPADVAYLDALIERNPEYTKRELSTGAPLAVMRKQRELCRNTNRCCP